MRLSHFASALLTFSLGLCCAQPALARMDTPPGAGGDPNMVIYLGNIPVRGQQNITRTLQAIKVALTLPYSNDPKMADVMVCRLEDKAGSHVKQELICGTNRVLSQERAARQVAMTLATAQHSQGAVCADAGCYEAVFDALNTVIEQTSSHYLHTTVDGAALRGLLQQLQPPEYEVPVQVAAPAAASKQ